MSNEKLNTENLPLSIDGKIEMVPKRQYANHTASNLTIKFKSNITKGNITDMIQMIVEGRGLEEGGEPIWEKVRDIVAKDIEMAQEQNSLAIEKANAEAALKKEAEEGKKVRDQELAKVASNTDVAASFASLGEFFDLGNMDRCVPKEGVTDEQLVSALAAGIKMENFSNWAKGDLVAELEKRGHEGAMVLLCEQTGIPYKSIYRMAVTARNVPPDNRKPGVSFTTYSEIAMAKLSAKPDEQIAKVKEIIDTVGVKVNTGNEKADAAENAGIITTAQEARKAIQSAQGKAPPTPADPMAVDLEKHTFIVVDTATGTIQACVGYPKSLEGTDAVIVHAKTARKAYGEGKKLKWTALDPHTEPEPEKDEKEKAPAPAPAAKPAAKKAAKKK